MSGYIARLAGRVAAPPSLGSGQGTRSPLATADQLPLVPGLEDIAGPEGLVDAEGEEEVAAAEHVEANQARLANPGPREDSSSRFVQPSNGAPAPDSDVEAQASSRLSVSLPQHDGVETRATPSPDGPQERVPIGTVLQLAPEALRADFQTETTPEAAQAREPATDFAAVLARLSSAIAEANTAPEPDSPAREGFARASEELISASAVLPAASPVAASAAGPRLSIGEINVEVVTQGPPAKEGIRAAAGAPAAPGLTSYAPVKHRLGLGRS